MLPEVENPIPETIGLDTIVATGAAVGMACLVAAVALRFTEDRANALSRFGIATGFVFAAAFYFLSLAVQLLCRQ